MRFSIYSELQSWPGKVQRQVYDEAIEQVVNAEPVPVRQLQPGVPRDLETVCLACLRKDPRKRYASADAQLRGTLRNLGTRPLPT